MAFGNRLENILERLSQLLYCFGQNGKIGQKVMQNGRFPLGIFISRAKKRILNLVKWWSLVGKYCKMWEI